MKFIHVTIAGGCLFLKSVHSFTLSSTNNNKCPSLSVTSMEGGIDSSTVDSSSPPDMKAYAAGYSTVYEEVPFAACKATEGKIPDDLIGTYFKSGPAMFTAGSIKPPKKSIVQPKQDPVPDGIDLDRMVAHPFDGDGAILGMTFSGDGAASLRYRYVRTTAYTTESKKGFKRYTGMEQTRSEGSYAGGGHGNDFPKPLFKHHLMPGLNKKRKNTSNTRAIYWSKKLLTMWEGGAPYKLDSLGLSTEGKSLLGGVLGENDPFGGKAAYDPVKERMLFYSNKQDSGSSELTLFEFNSKFRLTNKNEYKLPGFAVLSDFTATPNFAIFVQPQVDVNTMQYFMSKEPAKSLTLKQGESALLHLVPRSAIESEVKTIPIPFDGISDADLQFCNAYEGAEGKSIVFDVIRSDARNVSGKAKSWPWASTLEEFQSSASKKSLWRYTVSTTNGKVDKECMSNLQTSFGVINPAVNGKDYNYIYATVGALGNEVTPPQGIGKIDVKTKISSTWFPKEHEFCGEPMFAPRKQDGAVSEDDGYILSVLFNGEKKESDLLIFDAKSIQKGPIARIPLGVGIPHGLHGCFADSDECNWAPDEIERRAKLADKMESRGNMWNEVKSDFSGLGLRLDDWDEYFGDIL